MKTIVIDCRFASTLSGLGRYTRELTVCLLERATDVRYVLLVRSADESWIPADHPASQIIIADCPHYSLSEQFRLPALIRKSGADLFFSPHFNVPFVCPVPFVITVHDLILHRFPNDASVHKTIAYRMLMKHAITNARSICTISEFVHMEIRDAYGDVAADKTHVIREGVSAVYRPASEEAKKRVRHAYDLRRPFFLYVGNAKEHKNVQTLIDAFAASGDTERELILLTGGKEVSRLTRISPRVRMISDVSDQDLPVFYSLTDAFFTATRYEGYCLPVAEALACGCPVAVSDLSVIREIADGHATFVEPEAARFADAMRRQYAHAPSVVVGTWEKAAEETERVLLDALMH